MASQRFYILGADDLADEDGVIQTREKQSAGKVYEKDGPSDKYFDCHLDGYWIISDEDYKLFRELKRK